VPQEIPYASQLGPGNSGAQFLSRATEFPGRLADLFQTALYSRSQGAGCGRLVRCAR
jgi:hypothetical protein